MQELNIVATQKSVHELMDFIETNGDVSRERRDALIAQIEALRAEASSHYAIAIQTVSQAVQNLEQVQATESLMTNVLERLKAMPV